MPISVLPTAGPVQTPGTALTSPPKVDFRLPSYDRALPGWKRIRDCVDGQDAVQAEGTTYLPYIMPSDRSAANVDRNDSYAARAVFVGFTKRTLKGLIGQVFAKPALLDIPSALEDLRESIDGGAVSWDQQAKQALSDTLGPGRCGLLADYPRVQVEEGRRAPSALQQKAQGLRPTLQYYFAEQIINWRVDVVGGLRKTTLVVLEETYDKEDDGFKKTMDLQWRELRLEGGIYTQQIWRKINGVFERYEDQMIPKDASGKPFDEILFAFVGSDNNDPGIDDAPLLDMANLNIAHYRNSADFEEMVSLLGQPTPWFSGLSQKWIDEVWKDGIALGSRSAIPLPMGAQAGLLQVNESSIALQALEQKERQAVALGAKLVEQKVVQRTATEANQEAAAEASVLQTAAQNVSDAYTRALRWLAAFVGVALTEEQGYELNTDFDITRMTMEARKTLLAEWQAGAISYTEYRDILRRAGIATLDDEEAQAEIDAQTEKDMDLSLSQMDGETELQIDATQRTAKPPPAKKK